MICLRYCSMVMVVIFAMMSNGKNKSPVKIDRAPNVFL